ncbi:MAG: hypothetical protein ACR2H1_11970, partial [Limisphaerales bacterium]
LFMFMYLSLAHTQTQLLSTNSGQGQYNPDKKDYRLRNEVLRNAGNVGDVLRIELTDGKAGFDYYVEVIPPGTSLFEQYAALCSIRSQLQKEIWLLLTFLTKVKNAFRINRVLFENISRDEHLHSNCLHNFKADTLCHILQQFNSGDVHPLTSSYRVVVAHDNESACAGL